jgi:hypothetical protein
MAEERRSAPAFLFRIIATGRPISEALSDHLHSAPASALGAGLPSPPNPPTEGLR